MTHADVGVRQASATAPDLGAMPVWNLGDLYPSPTSAEFRRDLDRAAADAKRIADSYKGKLAGLGKDGAALAEAVKAYEALSDVMGRLGSYAGLLYAADTTDPAKSQVLRRRAGEADRHLHRPGLLRARAQQDRRDAISPRRCRCRRCAVYKPWLDDLRKEKPYQLEERLERLFHEKAMTGTAPGAGCSARP